MDMDKVGSLMKTLNESKLNESKSMYKEYSGFKVLNLDTEVEKIYPYVKGEDSVDTENKAIKDQMKLTDLPRSSFTINGLVRR